METRANYALIGAFVVAVIASAFGFVLWFASGDQGAARSVYKVVFTGSVSGLSKGAGVLFNGVRVGSVTKIDFEPESPGKVYALIEIDADTPIRTDTKARLETTGLTGVANIALSGGSESAPALKPPPKGGPPVIVAEPSEFQDLIASARRIAGQASEFLDRTNKVLDANSGSITTSIHNLQKFTDALAANSEGLNDFLGTMSEVGRAIKPLTARLESLAGDADAVVKAVDPKEVKAIVANFGELSAKLNAAADKVDSVLTNLNGFLATGDNKGAFAQVAEAAASVRQLADNVNRSWKDIGGNLSRFSNQGLREYQALAADGRRTLGSCRRRSARSSRTRSSSSSASASRSPNIRGDSRPYFLDLREKNSAARARTGRIRSNQNTGPALSTAKLRATIICRAWPTPSPSRNTAVISVTAARKPKLAKKPKQPASPMARSAMPTSNWNGLSIQPMARAASSGWNRWK